MSISVQLAQILEAGRTQFNARVMEARHRYPALNTDDFTDFLRTSVDPVVLAAATVAPEQTTPVTIAAYDIGLELVGQKLAGNSARHEFVDKVWQNVLPHYAKLLIADPYEFLGMLSNAAVNLLKVPNAHLEKWVSGMIALSIQSVTIEQLRATGQIMAWRSGMPHYRRGALSAADQLPERLALTAVGAKENGNWPDVKSKFLASPWWSPDIESGADSRQQEMLNMEIGEFIGLGGKFRLPPEVRATDDGFFIKSSDQYFHLLADIYGAILLPATEDEFVQARQHHGYSKPLIQGSTVTLASRKISLDLPVEGLSFSSNEHTLAVSSPYTFSIQIFPVNLP